jgi:Ulp1 family protease
VIFPALNKICCYDSMYEDRTGIMTKIRTYLGGLDTRTGLCNIKNAELINVTRIPQQQNGCDCGVCVMVNADYILDDLIGPEGLVHANLYNASMIESFREIIACHILRGYVNY